MLQHTVGGPLVSVHVILPVAEVRQARGSGEGDRHGRVLVDEFGNGVISFACNPTGPAGRGILATVRSVSHFPEL